MLYYVDDCFQSERESTSIIFTPSRKGGTIACPIERQGLKTRAVAQGERSSTLCLARQGLCKCTMTLLLLLPLSHSSVVIISTGSASSSERRTNAMVIQTPQRYRIRFQQLHMEAVHVSSVSVSVANLYHIETCVQVAPRDG